MLAVRGNDQRRQLGPHSIAAPASVTSSAAGGSILRPEGGRLVAAATEHEGGSLPSIILAATLSHALQVEVDH